MSNTEEKFVYTIENPDGARRSNWATGTRIYTRKCNAEKLSERCGGTEVVTYKLFKVEE